jgi:hypothetical protein
MQLQSLASIPNARPHQMGEDKSYFLIILFPNYTGGHIWIPYYPVVLRYHDVLILSNNWREESYSNSVLKPMEGGWHSTVLATWRLMPGLLQEIGHVLWAEDKKACPGTVSISYSFALFYSPLQPVVRFGDGE